jgi:hypothetical protein
MFRNLALSLILTVTTIAFSKTSFATTYVDNGTATTYTINAGDSLYIASGTYTGQINGLGSVNAKITINSGATFQPSGIPNNAVATINNYGTAIFNYNIRTNTNFTLNNYGIFSVSGTTTIVGNNQTWTNNIGGTMNFFDNVLMNGNVGDVNNTLINYETVNCTGTFQMNSGSAYYNYKDFSVTGTFRVNGGIFENTGKMDVTGNILMNNGASVIRNYCSMTATSGINNTSGNFYNYSFLWAINSDLSNSANIFNLVFNHSTPMIQARNFTLSTGGNITGPCLMHFSETTTHTGGTIGVAGTTTDTIRVNDITRTQPTQIFDVQSGGTRHPNVIYNAWGTPDTSYQWFWGCSFEYLMNVPLAVNWNSFYVYLADKIPVLNWSADYQEGSVFEIQRSYDGRIFTGIKQMPVEVGQSQYSYNDVSVNSNFPIAYYRIMAVEPGGIPKFTQVRNVRFNGKAGTIHVFPNPFANNFMIDYNAKENEEVIVRIFNAAGQQKLVKKISAHNGTNRIEINEAANFSTGIYIVQVSNASAIISSGKIIKQ